MPISARDPDEELVETAVVEIQHLWAQGLRSTVVALGDYLIDKFYGGSVEEARSRRPHKAAALARLLERAEELPVTVHALKQAVRIAVQYRELPPSLADRLSKTQHEALLPVTDATRKCALAEEAVAENLTSRELQERVNTAKPPRDGVKPRVLPVTRRVGRVLRMLETSCLPDELKPATWQGLPEDEAAHLCEQAERARDHLERLIAAVKAGRSSTRESPGVPVEDLPERDVGRGGERTTNARRS